MTRIMYPLPTNSSNHILAMEYLVTSNLVSWQVRTYLLPSYYLNLPRYRIAKPSTPDTKSRAKLGWNHGSRTTVAQTYCINPPKL